MLLFMLMFIKGATALAQHALSVYRPHLHCLYVCYVCFMYCILLCTYIMCYTTHLKQSNVSCSAMIRILLSNGNLLTATGCSIIIIIVSIIITIIIIITITIILIITIIITTIIVYRPHAYV